MERESIDVRLGPETPSLLGIIWGWHHVNAFTGGTCRDSVYESVSAGSQQVQKKFCRDGQINKAGLGPIPKNLKEYLETRSICKYCPHVRRYKSSITFLNLSKPSDRVKAASEHPDSDRVSIEHKCRCTCLSLRHTSPTRRAESPCGVRSPVPPRTGSPGTSGVGLFSSAPLGTKPGFPDQEPVGNEVPILPSLSSLAGENTAIQSQREASNSRSRSTTTGGKAEEK